MFNHRWWQNKSISPQTQALNFKTNTRYHCCPVSLHRITRTSGCVQGAASDLLQSSPRFTTELGVCFLFISSSTPAHLPQRANLSGSMWRSDTSLPRVRSAVRMAETNKSLVSAASRLPSLSIFTLLSPSLTL